MKRLCGILIFLGIFLIFLVTTSRIMLPKSNDPDSEIKDYISRGFYGEPENSIDVVMIGDSNTYCGIIPMMLWRDYGIASYVCAEPLQLINESYYLLKEFLKKHSPKLVILEVGPASQFHGVEMIVDNTIREAFPVVRYHNRWKNLSCEDFTQKPNYTWRNSAKGYYISTDVLPYTKGQCMLPTDKEKRIWLFNLIYLKMLCTLCANNDIDLLFMSVPSPNSWNSEKHNAIANFSRDRQIPFIDFNESEELINWQTDTLDAGSHLNFWGAQKVTARLGEYLSEHFTLPDHRSDDAYSAWRDDLAQYEKLVIEHAR